MIGAQLLLCLIHDIIHIYTLDSACGTQYLLLPELIEPTYISLYLMFIKIN